MNYFSCYWMSLFVLSLCKPGNVIIYPYFKGGFLVFPVFSIIYQDIFLIVA